MAEQQEECAWCERAWAVISIVVGAGLLFIAVDTLTEGKLTQAVLRRAPVLASVTSIRGEDDRDAS